MALEIDAREDFDFILDFDQPLTLHRHGTSVSVAIAGARRFSLGVESAASYRGAAARHDAAWQFSWQDLTDLPRIRDTLTDAEGNCWGIVQVERLEGDSRLRCTCRNVRILHTLNDWVSIEIAVWDDLGSGPEIVDWQTVRPTVAARIDIEKTTVDNAANPPTSTATYRVTLGEPFALDHNHRLVDPDGRTYQIVEYLPAPGVDDLDVVRVEVG